MTPWRTLRARIPERWLRIGLWMALVLNVAQWAVPFYYLAPRGAGGVRLPLHYSVHLGVDFVAAWWVSLWMPAFVTLVLVGNVWLSLHVEPRFGLVATWLRVAAVVVSIMVSVALFFVLVVNT